MQFIAKLHGACSVYPTKTAKAILYFRGEPIRTVLNKLITESTWVNKIEQF